MSASDTVLSADFNKLEVKNAPIPTTTLSSETIALLDEVLQD